MSNLIITNNKKIEPLYSSAEETFNASSKSPSHPEHTAYLTKKGLEPADTPDARFGTYYETPSIILPIKNLGGRIQSIQYIYQDKDGQIQKRFLQGGDKAGYFLALDNIEDGNTLFVTEGYATAVSLKKILKSQGKQDAKVICGFSAQDLPKVAQALKERFGYSEIIAAPDSDEAGSKAAKECQAMGVYAIFPPHLRKGMDWNDLLQEMGISGATDAFEKTMHWKEASAEPGQGVQSIPEIENILEEIEEDPCKGLSMEHFPPVLKDYIESLCETTEAHPIMIVMSILCSISAMVGRKAYMPNGEYFQNLYPNIWSLCITKSGGFKSTALNKGSEIALEENSRILRTMEDIKNSENPNFSLLEDDKNFSEGLKKELREESLKRPVLPTRTSTEFLIKHLAEGHKGMILSSEMGEWLGNMQKQHNVDLKQIFTYFYDVDITPYEHRTKHCGSYIVENPFITINGVSTISWIEGQVKADDVFSGFFARVLLFNPPSGDKIPNALPKKKKADSLEGIKAKKKITETLEHLGEVRFSLSQEAEPYFIAIHASLYQMVRSGNHDERCQRFLEPYLKRWSPYVLKLAMLFRIIEDPLSDELSISSIKAATEIVRIAIKSTAKLFKKELGESEDQNKQRKVCEWVLKRHQSKSRVDFRGLVKSKILAGGSREYEEVLQTLIDAGKIKCRTFENKKNKSDWILEVPTLPTFAD